MLRVLVVFLLVALPEVTWGQSTRSGVDSTTGVAAVKPAAAPYVHTTDSWFGEDKVKHFFIAGFAESLAFAGLEAVGGSRSNALGAAVLATGVLSVGREIHDRRTKGLFSVRDLAWDTLGAGAAFLMLSKTQK